MNVLTCCSLRRAAAVVAAASPLGVPLCSSTTTTTSARTSSPPAATRTPLRSVHIEHSSDVHKWRNPEKEEVRRQFRGGVKLGSEFVKFREQEEIEKKLIEEDRFTNWRLVYAYSLGAALLLIGLNLVMVFVKPNPSPEYVPYVDPSAAADSDVNTVTRAKVPSLV
jgi:hypothetical protein